MHAFILLFYIFQPNFNTKTLFSVVNRIPLAFSLLTDFASNNKRQQTASDFPVLIYRAAIQC